ncbi:unnamed protein product, partial [Ixodes pacificus]
DAAGLSVSCKTSSTCATSSLSSLTSNSPAVTAGRSPKSCDASPAGIFLGGGGSGPVEAGCIASSP